MLAKRQSQFELFPGSLEAHPQDWDRRQLLLKNLTLSLENIIVLSILLVMALVLFYAYGVERGKQVAKDNPSIRASEKIEVAKSVVNPQSPMLAQTVVKPALQNIQPSQPRVVATTQTGTAQRTLQQASQAKTASVKNPVVVNTPRAVVAQPVKSGYTVQVASYKTQEMANRAAVTLKNIGQEISVMAKGEYQILCVGRFNTEVEAKKLISKLKNRFKDCLVRRL
jgi:hypothetical protein